MEIREGHLEHAAVKQLLATHLEQMHAVTPPESVHALGWHALRGTEITFWSMWEGDELLGCGALKQLGVTSGEIKSMHTAAASRGRGVGAAVLKHITQEARRRRYTALHLETGASEEFAGARRFYERHGFTYRAPFADYANDPNSVFMTKSLG